MALLKFCVYVFMTAIIFVICDALQCYQCGQYNDGVGSITPCLNYSVNLAHLHLKSCFRTTDKYCIKYVSELSTVRDCVAQCDEKDVWNTKTYCCDQDGCNGNNMLNVPTITLPICFLIYFIILKIRTNKCF